MIPKKNIINPVETKTDQSEFLAIKSMIPGTAIVHPRVDISIPIM